MRRLAPRKRWVSIFSLIVVFFIATYLCIAYFFGTSSKSTGFTGNATFSSLYIKDHKNGIESILADVMDAAEKCTDIQSTCEKTNQTAIYTSLNDTGSYTSISNIGSLPDFPSTYFIRIKNHTIQKLFLSGKFVNEKINTLGELQVYWFLKHGKNEHLFCPDNDFFLLNFNCLRDFSSKRGVEDIIKIKNQNEQVVGAVTRIYGS